MPKLRVLVVDDVVDMAQTIANDLESAGFDTVVRGSGALAIEAFTREPCDVVVTDLRMKSVDGLDVLAAIKRIDASVPVIIMTAFGAVETAVEAMRRGAYSYVEKPFELDALHALVDSACRERALSRENAVLRRAVRESVSSQRLVGQSAATGFVTASGAILIGVLAGVVPFLACTKMKAYFKYDDALDTFGVHGVGGTMGALVTGFFATPEVNANLSTNLADVVGKTLWIEQLKAIGLTLTLSVVGTVAIAMAVKAVIGLRPATEHEEGGLDDIDHGESGYHHEEGMGHGDPGDLVAHSSPAAVQQVETTV